MFLTNAPAVNDSWQTNVWKFHHSFLADTFTMFSETQRTPNRLCAPLRQKADLMFQDHIMSKLHCRWGLKCSLWI